MNGVRKAGLLLLLFVTVPCLFAPLLAPLDPLKIDIKQRFQGPGKDHWIGTDEFGRDNFSRLLSGGRTSLLISCSAVTIAAILGSAIGMAAGLRGGWVDQTVLLGADILLSFPGILLALLILALAGSSAVNVVVALAILYAPVFTRLARNLVQQLREADFILACRMLGVSTPIIVFCEILPNIISPLLAQAVTCFAWALLAESGLSFLGLGTPPPQASWGAMLASARDYIDFSAIDAVAPALAIFLAVWGANLFADNLRERAT